jgi:hypothetical protein
MEAKMLNGKILLAAAALMATSLAAPANAAAWDHRFDRHPVVRHEVHRHVVERMRIVDTLRLRHYRMVGDPYFVRGHYVVRSVNRFGRTVFVEVNPFPGAFIGEFRI